MKPFYRCSGGDVLNRENSRMDCQTISDVAREIIANRIRARHANEIEALSWWTRALLDLDAALCEADKWARAGR